MHGLFVHIVDKSVVLMDCGASQTTTVIKAMLKPKNIPMQPRVMLESEYCPETPDQRKQRVYRSFVAKLQFAEHGPDATFHTPQRGSHDFAHPQEYLTGQPYII